MTEYSQKIQHGSEEVRQAEWWRHRSTADIVVGKA